MLSKIIENEVYKNAYQTVILLIVLSIFYIVAYFILVNQIKSNKNKLKVRLIYISIVTFILFCAKIWVQGFTHIFYGLSLVSAGLVVTNKETIMNLVGWGIISWRGLFSEGDHIEVGGNAGYVYELGILYFKILENSSVVANRSSGKIIKVPNGLIINTPIKTFSPKSYWLEQQLHFFLPRDIDIDEASGELKNSIDIILKRKYLDLFNTLKNTKKDIDLVKKLIYRESFVSSFFSLEKPELIKFSVSYYCLAADVESVNKICQQAINKVCSRYYLNVNSLSSHVQVV